MASDYDLQPDGSRRCIYCRGDGKAARGEASLFCGWCYGTGSISAARYAEILPAARVGKKRASVRKIAAR